MDQQQEQTPVTTDTHIVHTILGSIEIPNDWRSQTHATVKDVKINNNSIQALRDRVKNKLNPE
jgi:hypothetical protein